MSTKQALKESVPPDTTLHEELLAVGDDDIVEMANLFPKDTGIEGVIFISTVMASHGPRIKYSLKAGRHQPSFSVSISPAPRILASSLPDRVVNRVSPAVIEWVKLNREALLQFWNEADSWPIDDLSAFVKRLKKLPRD
jgi:hypothetical protein